MTPTHVNPDDRPTATMDDPEIVQDPSPEQYQKSTDGRVGPRICLAMPLYNQTQFLEEALQSLLAQTYSDFRLLVVDDSTEPSPGVMVRRYAAKDNRIEYIKNESRKGMVGNWRACFKYAGDVDYFAWVGDHDVWHPEWLEKMVESLNKYPNVVLTYPVFERITTEGNLIDKPSRYFSTDNMSERRRIKAVCREARAFGKMVYGLFRAKALQRAGVFRRVLFPDVILIHELALQGDFKQVKEKLWYIRRVAKFSIERQKNSLFIRKAWYIYLPWPLVNAAVLAWNTAIVSETRSFKLRLLGLYVAIAYFFRYIGKLGTGSWIGSYHEWIHGKKPLIKKWKKRKQAKWPSKPNGKSDID